MALYQNDAISINVGERLRELRAINEYSLRALAMRSGLSIHTLSMIEKGKTTPSISTLYKLAEALNVPITYFFNPNNNRRPVIYLKADDRAHMPFSRGVFEGLGGENFVGNIEPFLLTLESSANSGPQGMSHTGEEFVFCLRGQLEYGEYRYTRRSNADQLPQMRMIEHVCQALGVPGQHAAMAQASRAAKAVPAALKTVPLGSYRIKDGAHERIRCELPEPEAFGHSLASPMTQGHGDPYKLG